MCAYLCMHACVGTTYVSTCALNHYHTHHLLMHWVINSKTVSAVLWIVACLEAKLGTNASTILVTIGSSRSHNRGTILLNASRACKFTLLLASVSRGRNASNTYKNATCMVSCNADINIFTFTIWGPRDWGSLSTSCSSLVTAWYLSFHSVDFSWLISSSGSGTSRLVLTLVCVQETGKEYVIKIKRNRHTHIQIKQQ